MQRQKVQELKQLFFAANKFASSFGRRGLYDPEDIAQAALLKAIAKKDGTPVSDGWIYLAVRSAAYDAGRKHARESRFVCSTEHEFIHGSVCEHADESGNVYLNGWTGTRIEREFDLMPQLEAMLARLTAPLRQNLLLYADGFTYAEIAEITKTSIGTVRSRLHYARRYARSALA